MRTKLILMASLALGCLAAGAVIGQEAPQEPAPAGTATPPPQGEPHNNVRRASRWKPFRYACAGGETVTVLLNGTTARVQYRERGYVMEKTKSADGTRYSDGRMAWWSKGNGGFLQEDAPDGNGKIIVKGCELQPPPNQEKALVTGTVNYLQKVALPPTAVIEVKLRDASLPDTPASELAQTSISLGVRHVPLAFELYYDAAKIDAKHKYAVSARLLVNGEAHFVNEKAYPVLTAGNPSQVNIILKQVEAGGQKKP